jgi:hypothetical protein
LFGEEMGEEEVVQDNLRSNWSVSELLAELRDFRRVDDGSDLLAFRLIGSYPQRSVYVYLFGENPDLIHFDLEDEFAQTGQWDHAVRRGWAGSVVELQEVVGSWLGEQGSAEQSAPANQPRD